MKGIYLILILLCLFTAENLTAEVLFEIKDQNDSTVFQISDDGLRVFNLGDTLMVISATSIQANIKAGKGKALSRSFSVSTNSSGKAGISNVLEVTTEETTMREGGGDQYTNFSPDNIFLGLNSGSSNSTGYDNVFVGNNSGVTNDQGAGNVFLGHEAGYNNTGSNNNVFIGEMAGKAFDGSYGNVFIGQGAAETLTLGMRNTFIGYSAGSDLGAYTSLENVYLGSSCGRKVKGDYNVMIGASAGENYQVGGSTGSSNVFIGRYAGQHATGSNNIYIGESSGMGDSATPNPGSNNIYLGKSSGKWDTSSNRLYIDTSGNTLPMIYGEFDNDVFELNTTITKVKHPTGYPYGFYIQNTSGLEQPWHFYQSGSYELLLYYDGSYVGEWDTTTGAYTSISDKKFKKNIEDYTKALDKVMMIQAKSYNFISQNDKEMKYTGLIAQEIQDIFPEFVRYNKEQDTYTVDYAGLSVVALQAVKELNDARLKDSEKIENMEKDLLELKKIIDNLK